jgi:hypothetical protein
MQKEIVNILERMKKMKMMNKEIIIPIERAKYIPEYIVKVLLNKRYKKPGTIINKIFEGVKNG